MKYRKLKYMGMIGLSMVIMFNALSASAVAMQREEVQVKTVSDLTETRKAEYTEDIEFLNKLDSNTLFTRTVTDKQAEEMLAVVNQVTANAKSDYEKAKLLQSWINTTIKYEAGHVAISAEAYKVFTEKKGVCGGFANLYRELLNLAGIPAVVVNGYYNDPYYGYLAHAWNLVYVDGKWIIADGTGYGLFDDMNMVNTHMVMEIMDTNIISEGIKIGYYHGVAIVGTETPSVSVTIPDEFQGMPVKAISYKLFDAENGVEKITIGTNVNYIAEDTLKSSSAIKELNVSENNANYASKDGALFSKDYKTLICYPKAREVETFTLPAKTTSFDIKEAFCSPYLKNFYVETGNEAYSSYEGCLYNADKTELLFVPLGKTTVKVAEKARISGTAFANVYDFSKITICGKKGDYCEQYANENNIKFVAIEDYSITYNLNDGVNSADNPSTYNVMTPTIYLQEPTKKGYRFEAWYSDKECTKKVTKITEGSTGNITLYAKWTANKYTIKFKGNGSTSGSMKQMSDRKYGNKYTLKENAFKRTGYTFAGWNTKADGSGTTYKNKASVKNLTTKNGNTVTLYAQWKLKNYDITYKLNGGKNNRNNPKDYTIKSSTITLKKPTRNGYKFVGWYSDKKCTKKVTKIKKGSIGNKILYAKWKK